MKVIENITIRYRAYDFLLMFYSNYGSISCRFWDNQCRKCCDLEIPIKV